MRNEAACCCRKPLPLQLFDIHETILCVWPFGMRADPALELVNDNAVAFARAADARRGEVVWSLARMPMDASHPAHT